MRGFAALGLLLALASCSPQQKKAAEGARAESLLTTDERRAMRLNPMWLVGYWYHEPDCTRSGGTSLWPDGTYTMDDGWGRWSLSGDMLTIVPDRPPSVEPFIVRLGEGGRSRLRIDGPDRIFVDWTDADSGTFYRCDPA